MSKSRLTPADLGTPLSEQEFDELDEFLVSDQTSDETLTIDGLDGYLTALAIGPTTLPPSYWLPGVWGTTEDATPDFETPQEAQHILGLILRQMNGIITVMEHEPDEFEPVFSYARTDENDREFIDGEAWAMGFWQGLMLVRQDWQPLFDSVQGEEWLRPLRLMGALDLTEEELEFANSPQQVEALTQQIAASIAAIYRYWVPHRLAVQQQKLAEVKQRAEPKVGRNDPCPCGSGKKFKKCCGAAATLH
ncbi:UPF0149 family protein [Paraburkholderia xenovorans]|uniref:UPF0149 family protein n=1 Tax=Paraburkholderia xenovorans TaxID=36873 RepID=UPI0038B8FB9C